jgi:hypothetical protein
VIGTPHPNPVIGIPHPNSVIGTPHPNSVIGTPHPNPVIGTPHPNPVIGIPHPNPLIGTPHPNPVIGTKPLLLIKYDPQRILSKGDRIIINKSTLKSNLGDEAFTVKEFTKQKDFPIVLNNSRKVGRNTLIMKLFPGAEEYIETYQSVDWKHLSTFILNKKGDYDKYLK